MKNSSPALLISQCYKFSHESPATLWLLVFPKVSWCLGKAESCEKKKPENFWENVAFHKNTFFYLRFSSYVLYHLFKRTFVGGRQSALTIIYFHYDWRLDWTTLVIELEYGHFWMALNSTGPHCTTFYVTWLSRTAIRSSRQWAYLDCSNSIFQSLQSKKSPLFFYILSCKLETTLNPRLYYTM